MLKAPISRVERRGERSSALVIVLFFVVLLSVVAIAFLSRSMTAVQVSAGSSTETKSKILAVSASDIIIGDLKQEIIAGSTNYYSSTSNPNSGTVHWPVYTPTTNLAAIPFMNGVPLLGGTNAIPNLVSRSVSPANTSGTAPYVAYPSYYTSSSIPPNRAASDSSALTPTLSSTAPFTTSKVNSSYPSLNGRYISPSQWNEHYLIARNNAVDPSGTITTDSTPTTNFVTPDWVVVTRSGATTVTGSVPGFSTSGGGLNDNTLSNSNYAVGRYAYAVYNEGGLLDMNAAGYPGALTSNQISKKGTLALADLTQLTTGTGSLTQTQINNLVGWRNYASAQLTSTTGSFGSVSFTAATATSWLTNFVTGNTNGFMQVVPPPSGVTTPPTDQAFLSRQQLISVTQSLGISPDYLQYMGTFSRGLEQPSTAPDPNRPHTLYNGNALPGGYPSSPDESTYIGNNDAALYSGVGDFDASGVNPTGVYNPSFLAIRVGTQSFTRWNGIAAIAGSPSGEPLVKTKFALSRLAMVAYNATNATAKATYATTSDPDPIYDRFGLTRTSTSSPWVYNHGNNYIMTLSQVAAAKREPDFAELLKAAILSGSLAKGGPNLLHGGLDYQYVSDTSTDLNVLQIMANLIDQQDTDSYPTQIQLGSTGRTVYGVEDLPYFYRYHLMSVVDTLPGTIVTSGFGISGTTTLSGSISTAVNYTTYTTAGVGYLNASWGPTSSGTATASINTMQAGTVSNTGTATLLMVPDLWNPHDQNTLASETVSGTLTLRPSQFRIYAVTSDPLSATGTLTTLGAEVKFSGSGPTANPPPYVLNFSTFLPENGGTGNVNYYWPISVQQSWLAPANYNTVANNVMYFADNGGTLFREPTLLLNSYPTGISLTGSTSPSVVDQTTQNTYFGMKVGRAPTQIQMAVTVSGTTTNYIVQGTNMDLLFHSPAGAYPQISFFLQYQDPNNASNWITYDVKYLDFNGHSSTALVFNNSNPNVLQTGQFVSGGACTDPRTARWGVTNGAYIGQVSPNTVGNVTSFSTTSYLLEPTPNANYNTHSLGQFAVLETDRARGDKGNVMNYSNPACVSYGPSAQMHWFSGYTFFASAGGATATSSPLEFIGLFSQNNPAITFNSRSGTSPTSGQHNYYEDADGMVRMAMGAYSTNITGTDTSTVSGTSSLAQASATVTSTFTTDTYRVGLPEATASTFTGSTAVASATAQTQSRPLILNRPFRSVSEMSYAFTGTPWKNIDFFTPASGDSALLDTFCLTEPPPSALVAGKVDLNTRQIPVLQAIIAGAYRDEYNNVSSPPAYALPPLSGAEAQNVATTLETITSDTTHPWRGPLKNISGLVGHYVATPTGTDTDFVTYAPATYGATVDATNHQLSSMSYAGLSATLSGTCIINGTSQSVYSNTTNFASYTAPYIQRFREAALRPLVDAGQVRVWNLLIDVIAQTGRYPKTASSLDQFVVTGQTHLWVHVAIDRYTGQVIDKQVETVTP